MRPLHLKTGIGLSSEISDLSTDIFSFSVTIGPNEEHTASVGMEFDVIRYWYVVLYINLVQKQTAHKSLLKPQVRAWVSLSTYFGDLPFDISLKKCTWVTTLPIPILTWEVVGHDMTSNTCENNPALAHRGREDIVEGVVLGILRSRNVLLRPSATAGRR